MESVIEEKLRRIEELAAGLKNVLTHQEAATYLGLTRNYLYQLTHEHKIPYYKSKGGKYSYFKKSDLDAWATAQPMASISDNEQAAAGYWLGKSSKKGGVK